jgi:hypothetical protein
MIEISLQRVGRLVRNRSEWRGVYNCIFFWSDYRICLASSIGLERQTFKSGPILERSTSKSESSGFESRAGLAFFAVFGLLLSSNRSRRSKNVKRNRFGDDGGAL